MATRQEMSHIGDDGSEAAARVDRERYPYRAVGENIARGQRSADFVMRGWMDSPGHRKNILGDYTEVGLAVVLDKDGDPYWCVNFAHPWPQVDLARARRAILAAINRERSQGKLRPLRDNERLDRLAESRAARYAKSKTWDADERRKELETALRSSAYRYSSVMDMAAAGVPGPDEVVAFLLERPAYREAVLGRFRDIGIGMATGAHGTPHWDLILASPR